MPGDPAGLQRTVCADQIVFVGNGFWLMAAVCETHDAYALLFGRERRRNWIHGSEPYTDTG